MLDLVIRGGTVVDGTGAPGRRADVGVRDGRVVAVGQVDEPARRTIDAEGHVVAPGFIDLHVHYDAQLLWDPWATPSVNHGVTTVVGGNCGFTIAPLADGDADYIQRMLARVEGMPLSALRASTDWGWSAYAGWFERFEGKLGVNAGFMVGHSTVRRAVLGEGSGGPATDDQVAAMARLVEQALEVGAIGFSSSWSATHNDGDGQPVPSRGATVQELLALAGSVRSHPGTSLEFIPAGLAKGFDDEDLEVMAGMSLAAQRPLNWNLLTVDSRAPEHHRRLLQLSSRAAERGAKVVALTLPDVMRVRLSFLSGFGYDGLPGWADTMALPLDQRAAALADPAVRAELRAGAARAPELFVAADFAGTTVVEAMSPATAPHQGRTVGDVAAEQGADPLDVLLDIVLADELRTGLVPPVAADDDESWRLRGEVWADDRTLIGASDAGAHLDMMCKAGYATNLLGGGVRRRQLLSLEEAVRQLTDVPARLYGLRDRGRVAEGFHADLVVFDPATVDSGPERTSDDLPGGGARLVTDAIGVPHVLVNGTVVVEDGQLTGAIPGTLLRSGIHTTTPALA
jgi:N-acyl-D-aspartate/D-glutamate deacylase